MNLKDLIEAAKREDWSLVDAEIPNVCNTRECISWAAGRGLDDKDGNVRDLACTLLEKARIPEVEFAPLRERLHRLLSDPHRYARYRAAFAMASHGPGQYANDVSGVLEEASKDQDVTDIARGYLARLRSA